MKIVISLFSFLLLIACGTTNNKTASNEMVYWVNSQKVDCTGVAPMKCLQVQKGETMSADKWEYMYASIEGFDFEPGYQYKILVKEEKLDPKNVPADASSIKYTLVKMMDKKEVTPKMSDQEWTLKMVDGTSVDDYKSRKKPTIQLMTKDMKISGTDGCNNYFGNIENMDDKSLKISMLGKTKMACIDNKLPDVFSNKLAEVSSYKMMNNQLVLSNAAGEELLIFGK